MHKRRIVALLIILLCSGLILLLARTRIPDRHESNSATASDSSNPLVQELRQQKLSNAERSALDLLEAQLRASSSPAATPAE